MTMTRGDSPGRHFSVPPISPADASGLGALKADGDHHLRDDSLSMARATDWSYTHRE